MVATEGYSTPLLVITNLVAANLGLGLTRWAARVARVEPSPLAPKQASQPVLRPAGR